jgi:hypothetical protein
VPLVKKAWSGEVGIAPLIHGGAMAVLVY